MAASAHPGSARLATLVLDERFGRQAEDPDDDGGTVVVPGAGQRKKGRPEVARDVVGVPERELRRASRTAE